ncbi:hypothetical protein BT96DRAFT_1091522 [Gymnopus androsaceus JB14]|uniref:Uncharacterized protein n=1 Tax=Gymnopus androsaceus JB14 TaxID=1447944 RepID=A0A6A4GIV9_9AGAR|nr:hypothetical protein BT96DRAFT_1091522 [Gymnopus androsaceus JB14]
MGKHAVRLISGTTTIGIWITLKIFWRVDRVVIHQVVQQHNMAIGKAGIYTSFNARCMRCILFSYHHLHSTSHRLGAFGGQVFLHHLRQLEYQQFQQSPDLDEPDKSFLLVALDLLSGLTRHGVQASHDLWQSQPNLLTLLTICFKHSQAPVRQSAYVLVGDLASYMPGIIGLKRGFTQG